MEGVEDLRERYRLERVPQPFRALPELSEAGLTLGRGTLLAPLGGERDAEACERMAVLLAAVTGRPVTPLITKAFARAARQWRAGDGALAHIELAFARLPRLESEDDAFRLFLAERLLAGVMTPRALARALGFKAELSKYSPDQRRVPAGSGRESGQWTFGVIGDASRDQHTQIDASQLRFTLVQLAANDGLRPGGAAIIPLPRRDPLDPWILNKVPSPVEQQAIAETLNTILGGSEQEVKKLQPHSFQNLPHWATGATLPPALGGYRSYYVRIAGFKSLFSRLVIDQATHNTYYTNNHYFSFYHVTIVPK